MKSFWYPCAILALLLICALVNGNRIGQYSDQWVAGLNQSQSAAGSEDWSTAARHLTQVYDDWNRHQTYFHIVIDHKELDAAEALFQKSLRFAENNDRAEFQANTAELISQLRLLREMEEVSIKNIL